MMKRLLVVSMSIAIGLFLALGSSVFTHSAVNAQTPRVPTVSARQTNAIDVAFINEAAQAGLGNIMLGQLALQRSRNPQVTNFARAEIAEQQQNAASFKQIAPRIGATLPTTPGPKFQAIMTRMQQLSGTQFDNAYLDEGGVNAHLENAALFQREAAFGRNPDLIAVANRGIPIITQHFSTASSLTNYRQVAEVVRRYNNGQTTSATPVTPQTGSQSSIGTSQSTSTQTQATPSTGTTSTESTTTTPSNTSDIVPQRF